MKRQLKFVLVAASSFVLMPVAYSNPAAAATTVDDQRREVERVVDQLDQLGEQADRLAEDYNDALAEKANLDIEIEKGKAKIAEKQGEISELTAALEQVAIQSYTGADSDVMGPLFSDAKGYSDRLRSDEYRSAALDVGAVTTDDLDKVLSDFNDEQEQLDKNVARQAEVIKTINSKKADTDRLLVEYTQKRKDAEARLGELIAEEERRRAEAAWAAAQAAAQAEQAQQAQQAQAASSSGSNSGGSSSGSSSSSSGSSGNSSSSSGNSSSSGGSSSGGNSGGSKSGGGSSGGSKSGGGSSGGGGGKPAPSPSGLAGAAVAAARTQLGVPYVFGASSPGKAMDCSGLTSYAWRSAGISIARTSRAQAATLPRVSPGSAQPGDLIFYYSPVSHVGIYIGGGQMIHAPYTGTVVKVASVSWGKVTAVGRPG